MTPTCGINSTAYALWSHHHHRPTPPVLTTGSQDTPNSPLPSSRKAPPPDPQGEGGQRPKKVCRAPLIYFNFELPRESFLM